MAGRGLKSSHLVAVVHRASRPADEVAQVIHGSFARPSISYVIIKTRICKFS